MRGIGGKPERLLAAWAAALALLAQILVPQGFMLAPSPAGAAVVICTGHGPLQSLADLQGAPAKAPGQKGHGACVFAGHGAGGPVPAAIPPSRGLVEFVAPPSRPCGDLLPGRGLAAPPPPSQGPPSLLI